MVRCWCCFHLSNRSEFSPLFGESTVVRTTGSRSLSLIWDGTIQAVVWPWAGWASIGLVAHLFFPFVRRWSRTVIRINEHGREIRAFDVAHRSKSAAYSHCAFARDFPCGKFTSANTGQRQSPGFSTQGSRPAGRLRSFFHSRISLPHSLKTDSKTVQPSPASAVCNCQH